MQGSKHRVIIDTNCWISFLIGRRLHKMVDWLSDGRIQLLLCDELIEEIREVASRPKFRKYFRPADVDSLVDFLLLISGNIELKSNISLCRDAADDFLLALAVDAQANYLLTGDEDLLVLQKVGKCKIVDIQTFEHLWQ